VAVKVGQTAHAVAVYGSVINPGVRAIAGGLIGVVGDAEDPTALVYSGHAKPPGIGTILTSGPTTLLPVGLISRVTQVSHQHGRMIVTVVSVPVTDAVPQLSFVGSLQLEPTRGAIQGAGSAVPAQAASLRRAHAANACGIAASSSLLQVGAHLDRVELREAFAGAFPPQLKLTLAVRTKETLGLGLLSAGLNCSWTLAEIGPFYTVIPVAGVPIPVYATLPLNVKLSLTGSVQPGSINVASTTVAHVAAGLDENAASLSEQGTNVWSAGPSVSGSVSLAATIGVQAGIGIAKAANLHVEAAFGPEFDASTGHGCDLQIDLGSLSASAQILDHSLNTPSFTPFKIPLWSGCSSSGGGGGKEGGGKEEGPPKKEGPPKEEGPSGASSIAAGWSHTCALVAGGGVACWGYNLHGELGDGTTTQRLTPVRVSGITDATAVSAGNIQTCALLSGGSVDCWGANDAGQLGDGTETQRLTPVPVLGITSATAISAGSDYTCALLSGGSVDCWGLNDEGQLGDGGWGTTAHSLVPVPVSNITSATAISAGAAHACAVVAGGGVECWGANSGGVLGDGTTTASEYPVPVTGVTDATAVSAGEAQTCALLSGGSVDCWGGNVFGELGDGTTMERPTAVPVSGVTNATAISAGHIHTCALLSGGSVDCWGANYVGELGDGTTTERLAPVPVSNITNAAAISAGVYQSCAVLSVGSVECWGSNSYGELGDGTTQERLTPVPVIEIP
jgi:alpha-tubulin suppressor-like RCC1 family protein